MKKSLLQELQRIHEITYGKEKHIVENIRKKLNLIVEDDKVDDPKKADLVSSDVEEFFKNLESINGPLEQQQRGGMDYQKDVETVQMGLVLLGYELPRFGVDGLFGRETAAAVEKFKSDNNIKNDVQTLSESMTQLKTMSYPNLKHDFTNGTENDYVNQGLLDDIDKAAKAAGLVATITTAKSGHDKYVKSGKSVSRHMNGTGVDIAILDGIGAGGATNSTNGNRKFRELGDKLSSALESLGYTRNVESGNDKAVLWQTNTGGNHYNHLHVSNRVGASDLPASVSGDGGESVSEGSTITPEMVKVMIQMLRSKDLKSEDLKKLIDQSVRSGGKVEISLTGDWVEIAKSLLRKYEGFSETAKWDENAYRGGYGTDKKLVGGRLVNATQSTTWTQQEAEDTMEEEIKTFYGPTVAKQLGLENWNKLNDKQKGALVSLGYNAGPYFPTVRDYGKEIKSAIESGDMERAGKAIENGPTRGSVSGKYYSGLARRRKEESNVFLS